MWCLVPWCRGYASAWCHAADLPSGPCYAVWLVPVIPAPPFALESFENKLWKCTASWFMDYPLRNNQARVVVYVCFAGSWLDGRRESCSASSHTKCEGGTSKRRCSPGQGAAETVMESLQSWAPGQGFLQLSPLTTVRWIQIQKYLWNYMGTANAVALRDTFYYFSVSVGHWTLQVRYDSENIPRRQDFRFEIAAFLLPEINFPKPVSPHRGLLSHGSILFFWPYLLIN